ncbi:MAG: riboflavin kinase [bacterium]|nr:riboflavin kinase [bacterium]
MKNIRGVVIGGRKVGRLLGFPTANIKISSDLESGPGIYAGHIIIGATKYQSALYLAGGNVIEAFIFDFSGDLYEKEVHVEILKKIRDKRDFENDEEAIRQITKDVLEIKEFFQP